MSNKADLVFYGGDIITMDDSCNDVAEAVAVKGDKIIAVGKHDDVFRLVGAETQVIYLKDQTLLPGFIEPHQHAIVATRVGVQMTNISGYYYRSYEDVKLKIEEEVARVDLSAELLPWCMFHGWDPELIPNLPTLSATFLDSNFTSQIPVVIIAQNLHCAYANRKAFEIAEVDENTKDPSDGRFVRDESGHLTGKILEPSAIMRIVSRSPRPSTPTLTKAIKDQWKEYASRGFTTVTELCYKPDDEFDTLLDNVVTDWESCPLRVALYKLVYPDKPMEGGSPKFGSSFAENNKLWQAGIKIMADGSPHSGTAAVREPFLHSTLTEDLDFPVSPNYGELNHSNETLLQLVKFQHCKGKQVAIHAQGERAVQQVLDVYEQVLEEYPRPDTRHRIEHVGLATEAQIAQAARLDLALSFFVCHLYFYAKTFHESILGEERTQRWAPVGLATKHGLRWTIHQDQPAFPGPPLPFINMRTAVTRTQRDDDNTVFGPEYRVSVHEALKAYTIDAAWQIHQDDHIGSVTVNKLADLVILSHNPYKVDPLKLPDIRVVETFMGGRRTNLAEVQTLVLPEASRSVLKLI